MDTVRMQHPNLEETAAEPVEVPESAVGEHARAGWVIAAGEQTPECPACGQSLPVAAAEPPPDQDGETSEAPAESGASASKAPRRSRRSTSSEEGE